MSAQDTIKARIRALRAKTVQNGCTEAEAMAAAAKVVELMTRHGIEPGDVDMTQDDVESSRAAPLMMVPVFSTIAWVCHCEFVLLRQGEGGARYVGRDPWPEAATYLHEVIMAATRRAQMEFRATPEYRRWHRPASRWIADDQFLAGFMAEIRAKLRALKRAAGDADEQARDLALASSAVAKMGTVDARVRGARSSSRHGDSAAAGRKAGRETHIGWGIGAAGAPRALEGRR